MSDIPGTVLGRGEPIMLDGELLTRWHLRIGPQLDGGTRRYYSADILRDFARQVRGARNIREESGHIVFEAPIYAPTEVSAGAIR